MHQWKNIENRLIFDEDIDNQKVGRFLGHSVCVYCCLAGNTALLESVWVNDVNKAAVLVNAGANVLESNNGGDTVLHISALKGNADMTAVGIFSYSYY